jgi:hypothetical protein
MDKEELLRELIEVIKQQSDQREHSESGYCDCEDGHMYADLLLLEYIDDERITDAFDRIDRWYA